MRSQRAIYIYAALALVAGFLIGMTAGVYLLGIVAPQLVTGPVSPHQLYSDGKNPQFREYYAARVASRFTALGGAAQPVALQYAREELGIRSGAITPVEGVEMVRAAQAIAAAENAKEANPDSGRFTLQDQQNLAALGDRLDAVRGEAIPEAQAAVNPLIPRLLGALGLLTMTGLLVLALYALGRQFFSGQMLDDEAPVRVMREPRRVVEDVNEDELEDDLDAEPDPRVRRRVFEETSGGPIRPSRSGGSMTIEQDMLDDAVRVAPAVSSAANEQMIGTFNTTYEIGEDRYDDSFQINGSMGELIGECGASVVERIGHDTPAKVAALAVWLFDKSDFQSTTKVLMSEYAFSDPLVKDKLKNRGDALPARNGRFDIVTSTMRAEIEVSHLDFAPVGNQVQGYFEKVNLQFRIFKRAA